MTITYRIAETEKEYQQVARFAEAEGFRDSEIGFPTVMAFEGGELVAAVSTAIVDGVILGGPFVLKTDRPRSFTAMQIGKFYEAVLHNLGITRFAFTTMEGSQIDQYVRKHFNLEPYYQEADGTNFYWRKPGEIEWVAPRSKSQDRPPKNAH